MSVFDFLYCSLSAAIAVFLLLLTCILSWMTVSVCLIQMYRRCLHVQVWNVYI